MKKYFMVLVMFLMAICASAQPGDSRSAWSLSVGAGLENIYNDGSFSAPGGLLQAQLRYSFTDVLTVRGGATAGFGFPVRGDASWKSGAGMFFSTSMNVDLLWDVVGTFWSGSVTEKLSVEPFLRLSCKGLGTRHNISFGPAFGAGGVLSYRINDRMSVFGELSAVAAGEDHWRASGRFIVFPAAVMGVCLPLDFKK